MLVVVMVIGVVVAVVVLLVVVVMVVVEVYVGDSVFKEALILFFLIILGSAAINVRNSGGNIQC